MRRNNMKRLDTKAAPRKPRVAQRTDDGNGRDVREVPSRSIPTAVQNMLWGIAAGRCEFEGCNKPLWKNSLTQDERVIGQHAHIWAFSVEGPRGRGAVGDSDVHSIENVMLLCPEHHITVDRGDGPVKYTADRLRLMKQTHEARLQAACEVAPDRVSQVLTYATHVGAHHALPTMRDGATALLGQRRYPSGLILDLSTRDGADPIIDQDFWKREEKRLAKQFDRHIRQPLERGELTHVSTFALAPQPLLITLGTLIGDIVPADTYQRHREPQTWNWPANGGSIDFKVRAPERVTGPAALVFSISATVTADRIARVLGPDATMWVVSVNEPHNDVVKSPATLSTFRAAVRPLLDRMKAAHGHRETLHVFPAMPVSLAIEFGRIRMPKADMPWLLYDEQADRGGFVPALTIGHGA